MIRSLRHLVIGTMITSVAAGTLVLGITSAGAVDATTCRFDDLKAKIAVEVQRRDAMLDKLVANLDARKDPYSLNAAQIRALGDARTGVDAQGAKVAAGCYATRSQLRADAVPIFTDYRVYWLRVPQTHVIGAADHLGVALTRLRDAAAKLAPHVSGNAQAQQDLDAMNHALDTAAAKLGTPPSAAANIVTVAGLVPAVDMTANTAAINTARADLESARTSLVEARKFGAAVVHDLSSAAKS